MPHEFLPSPFENKFQGYSHEDQLYLIESLYRDVDIVLGGLEAQRREPSGDEQTINQISLNTRIIQLDELSQRVLELAKNGNDTEYINLDYTGLIPSDYCHIKPGYFPLHKKYIDEAVAEGEASGTKDFLSLIVPPLGLHIGTAWTHFYRWPIEVFERRFGVNYRGDGSALIPRATILPNIDVLFYYPDKNNLPERYIGLNT